MKKMAGVPQKRNDWELEQLFREEGPFFHLHTEPLKTGVIFISDEERAIALVYVAIAAECAGVEVLAYALMSNHFHFILRGREARCRDFFARLKAMLSLYFSRHGRPRVLDPVGEPDPTPITSLKQFRDEIAYVIRNPFVVRKDINLFAYPWCSGFLYFNPMLSLLEQRPVDTLTLREKRVLTRTRDAVLPAGLTLVGEQVFPGSFVNYRLVESMFTDSRQFVFWTLKNVEAQVKTALQNGEKPSLTDDEIISVTYRLCHDEFGAKGPYSLTDRQKNELAQRLKYDYYASNGQIARSAGLKPQAVDELFPLSAKPS